MEGTIAATVICHSTKDVACAYLLSFLYNGTRQVTIDGNVAAMPDKYVTSASKLEDTGDHTVEDGTGTGSGATYIVGALVVELDVLHAGHIVQSEAASHHILSSDGYGQSASVLFEGTIELAVFCREPSA